MDPNLILIIFYVAQQHNSVIGSLSVEVSRSHAIRQTTRMTFLNELSARSRGHYQHNTQQTQQTNIHALSGIRIRDPSKRAAADLRLRPNGNRDRRI